MEKTIFTYLLLVSFCLVGEPLVVPVKSEGAILYNPENGAILFEKNSDRPYYPASITKIATALFALSEKGHELDVYCGAEQECLASITLSAKKKAQYSLPSHWLETDGSHIGLKPGEQMRLRDLVAGMLICSGNDAANVIAQACVKDIRDFSPKINAYLKSLGCKNTHFVNPHGLHHPDHVTTAYDMALITKEAIRHPFIRETVSKTTYSRPLTNKQPEAKLAQTNRLLKPGKAYYSYAFGVKTGYTSAAQSTFVAAAEKNGRILIAVLLKCKEREEIFQDAIKLFKAAFEEKPVTKVYLDAGNLSLTLPIDGLKEPIRFYTNTPLALTFFPAEEPRLKAVIHWEPIVFPIKASQKLGTLSLQDPSGRVHGSVDLLSQGDVSLSWFSIFLQTFNFI